CLCERGESFDQSIRRRYGFLDESKLSGCRGTYRQCEDPSSSKKQNGNKSPGGPVDDRFQVCSREKGGCNEQKRSAWQNGYARSRYYEVRHNRFPRHGRLGYHLPLLRRLSAPGYGPCNLPAICT